MLFDKFSKREFKEYVWVLQAISDYKKHGCTKLYLDNIKMQLNESAETSLSDDEIQILRWKVESFKVKHDIGIDNGINALMIGYVAIAITIILGMLQYGISIGRRNDIFISFALVVMIVITAGFVIWKISRGFKYRNITAALEIIHGLIIEEIEKRESQKNTLLEVEHSYIHKSKFRRIISMLLE